MKNLVSLKKINAVAKKKTSEVEKISYASDGVHKYSAKVGNRNIKFGNINYKDNLVDPNPERKKKYRARHQHDKINQIGPGRYSWYLLWS